MGHVGCADDPRDPCNAIARQAFVNAVTVARRYGLRPSLRHLAATSATLTDPRSHFDLCRVGAGLVGIDPTGTTTLRPAMTLTAPVVSVRDAARGTSVGYGHTYLTARDTRLALLPLGYADGIPRAASGHGWVQLRGTRHRMVGLVSMDQIVIDVGSESVQVGDTAIIFGPGDQGEPTTADWARWAVTIEHGIVTGIGARVARRLDFPDRTDMDLVPARFHVATPSRGPSAACTCLAPWRRGMNDERLVHRPRLGVVVIGGGQNCEHEVSLASARSVAAALDADKYDVCSLTIGRRGSSGSMTR